jgi:hypothetical protein
MLGHVRIITIFILVAALIYFFTRPKCPECKKCADPNCPACPNEKSKLFAKAYFKGPLLSFSKYLLTVDGNQVVAKYSANQTSADTWFYNPSTKTLQHSSGGYIAFDASEKPILVPQGGSTFVAGTGAFQEEKSKKCLSIDSTGVISLQDACQNPSALFFTGLGKFSLNNMDWFSDEDLLKYYFQ